MGGERLCKRKVSSLEHNRASALTTRFGDERTNHVRRYETIRLKINFEHAKFRGTSSAARIKKPCFFPLVMQYEVQVPFLEVSDLDYPITG